MHRRRRDPSFKRIVLRDEDIRLNKDLGRYWPTTPESFFPRTAPEHLQHLREVLPLFQEMRITLSSKKSFLALDVFDDYL
jgi:hypothetical protein